MVSMSQSSYIGIDDEHGRQCWADVESKVIRWVDVGMHDELIAAGYIDLDGKVLVELEFSDD